jgi:serine/threonine protein kinase
MWHFWMLLQVYKGMLPTVELVAVKRAQEESRQETQKSKAEIEILSLVHHGNLVNLFGFCYDHEEQMLVYEFCMNGNL